MILNLTRNLENMYYETKIVFWMQINQIKSLLPTTGQNVEL